MVQDTNALMVQDTDALMVQDTKALMVQDTKTLMVQDTKALMVQDTKASSSIAVVVFQTVARLWGLSCRVKNSDPPTNKMFHAQIHFGRFSYTVSEFYAIANFLSPAS